LAEEHTTGPAKVPESEFARVRERQTLLAASREWMAPWRETERRQGDVSSGTLSKERQALNRWEAWELANPPDNWPAGTRWEGCPVGFIAGGYVDHFHAWLAAKYAKDTVVSTRNHLRTVLNFLEKIGAIVKAPQPRPLDLEDPDDVEEDLAAVWTADELSRLYAALAPHPALQTAFVFGCCVGPRSGDMFGMRWIKHVRLDDDPPVCRWRAEKSGKKHGIPLAPVVVRHLARLRQRGLFDSDGPVFRELTSIACADPEKSKAARRRNALMKRLMADAGVTAHAKPWQVCRATCCTRYNDVEPGIGSWVIGQGSDRAGTKLAEDFYYNPSALVVQTILRTPVPAGWE